MTRAYWIIGAAAWFVTAILTIVLLFSRFGYFLGKYSTTRYWQTVVATHIPRWLVEHAVYRAWGYASTGPWRTQIVPDLSLQDALKRWRWYPKPVQCCTRDDDHDGSCHVHEMPGVPRIRPRIEAQRDAQLLRAIEALEAGERELNRQVRFEKSNRVELTSQNRALRKEITRLDALTLRVLRDLGLANEARDVASNLATGRDALLEHAWTLIANAHEGDWNVAQQSWRDSAIRFRDEYARLTSIKLDAARDAIVKDATLERAGQMLLGEDDLMKRMDDAREQILMSVVLGSEG